MPVSNRRSQTNTLFGMQTSRAITFLAGLSGASGLAYQVLFVRLFSNYFGDGLIVAGVTLCSVFLGMSVGAWFSRHLIQHLGWIEILIGLYAMVMATLFSSIGFEVAGWQVSPLATAAKLVVLLGFPTFLIGTCIPLFSHYAKQHAVKQNGRFSIIYGIYNFGAFLSILAIEFWLFRQFGLQSTLYALAVLNIFVGSILLSMVGATPNISANQSQAELRRSIAAALFLASFASGIFQLYLLRVSFSIFGPLQENFAIILASAIGGIAIGAALTRANWWSLPRALVASGLAVLLFNMMISDLVNAWSMVSGRATSDVSLMLVKILVLGGLPLPVFILFGSLVPIALRAHESESGLPGKLLAVSSLGNGLGAVLMFLLLYRYLNMSIIGAIVGLILLAASFLAAKGRTSALKTGAIALLAMSVTTIAFRSWPNAELLLGYRIIAQHDVLTQKVDELTEQRTYKAYDQNASILSFADGSRSLVFNGYHSLTFGPGGKSELHEAIVGATPALFVGETNTALVLGLGTGISAGASAQVFDETRVVEINPAMLSIPDHFERENFGLGGRSNVQTQLQDGISAILDTTSKFDAIVNTVTTPRYYSASKLYTQDFLELAKERLSDSGVYSTWFDLNMGLDGISIMLNTLEATFENCRFFVMTASYFNAVCADHALIYQPSKVTSKRFGDTEFDGIFESYGFTTGFSDTISALEVSFDEGILPRNTRSVNTLDRPLIEFIVTRQSNLGKTNAALSQAIVANIERQRQYAILGSSWKQDCQTISRMSGLVFRGCD